MLEPEVFAEVAVFMLSIKEIHRPVDGGFAESVKRRRGLIPSVSLAWIRYGVCSSRDVAGGGSETNIAQEPERWENTKKTERSRIAVFKIR